MSQSFSFEEVKVLSSLLETLQRGGDVKVILRNPATRSVTHKAVKMRARIEALQAEKLVKSA